MMIAEEALHQEVVTVLSAVMMSVPNRVAEDDPTVTSAPPTTAPYAPDICGGAAFP